MEKHVNILWFRHGLRIHDNPALIESISEENVLLLPIFTFDGESAGTKTVGFNRMKFLLDSLNDLDAYFKAIGGKLHLIEGQPDKVFSTLNNYFKINKITFEQDCEPIWETRDSKVKGLNIPFVEKVSHTLWDPDEIITTNGGIPPLTYEMFLHTVQILGLPPRPVDEPKWDGVSFPELPKEFLDEFHVFDEIPTPEHFNLFPSSFKYLDGAQWKGGEVQAMVNLKKRLEKEEYAFRKGIYLPNQAMPNILENPMSLSAHLRFGCLSVRKFYWEVHDLFEKLHGEPSGAHITGQLIWREYFYTMSVKNPYYDQMEKNQICLNIPWAKPDPEILDKWYNGRTGFPLIDGAMRQLLAEGWLHHILRNTVATFLTRGGLWYSWEYGFQHFLKYLLDADWSVCAGNWMWVSSSAFEHLLDTSLCTSPLALSRRLDPTGVYIRHYVPELKNVPLEYLHEPWNMPEDLQKEISCIIGIHYPERVIDLKASLEKNKKSMHKLREMLMGEGETPAHCRPSNDDEIRQFFWLHN